jgi:hypothetical protein
MPGLFYLHLEETPWRGKQLLSVVIPIAMTAPVPIIITIAAVTVAVVAIIVIAALVAIVPIIVAVVSVAAIATLVGFAAFLTPMIGLTAVIAMVLYGFTQLVFRFRDAPLAIVTTCSLRSGRASKEKQTTKRRRSKRCLTEHTFRECRLTERSFPQKRMQLHTSSLGASLVLVGVFCVLAEETRSPEKCRGADGELKPAT